MGGVGSRGPTPFAFQIFAPEDELGAVVALSTVNEKGDNGKLHELPLEVLDGGDES